MHHWDSMMVFEETTKSLFLAYLYLQPDDQPAIVRENLSKGMCRWYRESGIFAAEEPARRVDRIQELDPHWVHPMHGGSLPKDVLPAYTRALKSEEFAYDGRVFGRTILG